MQLQCFFVWIIQNGAAGDQRKVLREQKLGLEQTCQLACHTSGRVHRCPHESGHVFFSSPGFVWTEALNHVILLLFVLVVISHAPNSMQPQCFFRADNSKWRCWWSAEGRKVSREQKLGLERTCQLACHTSCYVHTNMNIFFFQSWICVNRGLTPCHFVVVCFSGCFNSETLSLPSSS